MKNLYTTNLEGALILNKENALFLERYKNKHGKAFEEKHNINSMLVNSLFTESFFEGKKTKTLNNKEFTDIFINVSFDKDIYTIENNKKVVTKDKKQIRDELYKQGFTWKNKQYVYFGRGAGSARVGQCLFIQKKHYKEALALQMVGMKLKKNEGCDLASISAYRFLINSTMISSFNLQPHEILIVEDIQTPVFKTMASTTRDIEGRLITQTEEIEMSNCSTDGESLGDISLFERAGYKDNGFMLLRNHWFKSCCFNVNLKQWYRDNNIKTVVDMFGVQHDAKDIKLVITPNSLKFLKMSYKFESKKACYDYWLDNLLNFGVVKVDHAGKYSTHTNLTYQILNSLPLSREEILKLAQNDLDHIDNLTKDIDYFKENMDLFGINKILGINSDFQFTKEFKEFRREQVKNLKNELKNGRIHLKDTFYSTLFANPIEFLQQASNMEVTPLMQPREVYNPYYEDGTELSTFRNPHIASGNVLVVKNTYYKELEKYVNNGTLVTIINVFENDFLERLQGADMDSDVFLTTPNEIVLNASKQCISIPTPVNKIEGVKLERRNNIEDQITLDQSLHSDFIGKICNKAQLLNSYYSHRMSNNASKEELEVIYNAISQLSSLSQVAIDLAKKSFDNIDFNKELRKFNSLEFEGKPILERHETTTLSTTFDGVKTLMIPKTTSTVIYPQFMKDTSKSTQGRVFESLNTPMDYLYEAVDSIKKARKSRTVELKSLLKAKRFCNGKRNQRHEQKILKIIENYKNELKYIKANYKENSGRLARELYLNIITEIQNIEPSEYTLCAVVEKTNNTGLKILLDAFGERIISLFSEEA